METGTFCRVVWLPRNSQTFNNELHELWERVTSLATLWAKAHGYFPQQAFLSFIETRFPYCSTYAFYNLFFHFF